MRIDRIVAAVALLSIVIPISLSASDSVEQGSGRYCKETGFGACRLVYGRYGIYVENNGIWDIRKKRLLTTAGDAALDKIIQAAGNEYAHEVLGDFMVCPRSRGYKDRHTRAWQSVCVQSYKNTQTVKRRHE